MRHQFVGHDVRTVPEMGWANKNNGTLLKLAAGQFDVLITADKHVPHHQNPKTFGIAIVAMSAKSNRLSDLKPLVPRVLNVLERLKPGDLVRLGA